MVWAVSLSSRSFANMRLLSSCFSFAESKAGLQDFAVLQHVGVMCSDKIELTRRWSAQHSAPRITGDSDVTDVFAATDGSQSDAVSIWGASMLSCTVLVMSFSAEKLNNMRPFEFSFPVP